MFATVCNPKEGEMFVFSLIFWGHIFYCNNIGMKEMKTRFQISSTSGSSMLTRLLASRPPMRSKCISEHGPHGPVSPIIQKLSFIPNGNTRSAGTLIQDSKKLNISECSSNYWISFNLCIKEEPACKLTPFVTRCLWQSRPVVVQANHCLQNM